MKSEIKFNQHNGRLEISGELNINTVANLRNAAIPLIKPLLNPIFDLQHTTQCDSSALALLTALTRDCKKSKKHAKFIHLPKQLAEMARLSNLNKVLTLM